MVSPEVAPEQIEHVFLHFSFEVYLLAYVVAVFWKAKLWSGALGLISVFSRRPSMNSAICSRRLSICGRRYVISRSGDGNRDVILLSCAWKSRSNHEREADTLLFEEHVSTNIASLDNDWFYKVALPRRPDDCLASRLLIFREQLFDFIYISKRMSWVVDNSRVSNTPKTEIEIGADDTLITDSIYSLNTW